MFFRVRTSFYSTIYKLPSDDVSTAKKIKEAPIKDNEDILADEKDKEQKERTTQLISIPVEVNSKSNKKFALNNVFMIKNVIAERYFPDNWGTT